MRRNLVGGSALAVLAVVCCAGIPLLAAAGLSAVALGVVGGVTAATAGLAVVIVAVLARARTRRSACAIPAKPPKEA